LSQTAAFVINLQSAIPLIMDVLTIDQSGQVHLPQKVREQLGLTDLSQLTLELQDGKIIFVPVPQQSNVYYEGTVLVVDAEPVDHPNIIHDL